MSGKRSAPPSARRCGGCWATCPLFTPDVQIVTTLEREHFTIEKIAFENGAGATVFGYVLVPRQGAAHPAVLYSHFHGGHYHVGKDEVFLDRVSVPPLGPALAEAGHRARHRRLFIRRAPDAGTCREP